jgi:hypothetical protein
MPHVLIGAVAEYAFQPSTMFQEEGKLAKDLS